MQRDYLVLDLEATCNRGEGDPPRDEMETIEIGAVLVRHLDLEVVDEFSAFIRPVRHPILTEFCKTLTTIGQADVDQAPLFPEVMERLKVFLDGRDPLFCSWGDFDRTQLEQDARFHGVERPFGPEHMNIKIAFANAMGSRKRLGMFRALCRVGLSLQGTHHRGIDDAWNIARLMPWALGREPFPPPPPMWRKKRPPGRESACAPDDA